MLKSKYIKYLILIITLFKYELFIAQECKCSEIINHLIKKTEEEYPAYNFILSTYGEKAYNLRKNDILKYSKEQNLPCQILVDRYISFFQDNHFNFHSKVDFSFDFYIKNSLKNTNLKELSKLIGIWQFEDVPFYIELKIANGLLMGKKLYDFGDTKDSLKWYCMVTYFPETNNYELLYNGVNGYNIQGVNRLKLINNKLFEGRIVKFSKVKSVKEFKYNYIPKQFEVKLLNSDNLYICIPNLFDVKEKDIDSILQKYNSIISKTKNLLIDLRDNTGGSALPMIKFNKLIYTNPIQYDNAFMYSNKENIASYENYCNFLKNQIDVSDKKKKDCDEYLQKLKNNYGKLVFDQSDIYIQDTIYKYPKNVAIIINKNTASAAEIAAFSMLQSRKVLLFGENTFGQFDTGGITDYTNCDYMFTFPIQMGHHVYHKKYDFIGISPSIVLDSDNKNWVDKIIKYYIDHVSK